MLCVTVLHTQVPTVLSISGAVLICVSTFSLGAFEKTHAQPSTSPAPWSGQASVDGLGAYSALPASEDARAQNGARV
jgi:hypothetical protein